MLGDSDDLTVLNDACRTSCAEVNARVHSETCTVPDVRLIGERELLRDVPMVRPRIGRVEVRKVDKLSTIRVASALYSVPYRLVGATVEAVTFDGRVRIYDLDGDLVADHVQLAPGEAAVLDEHYPTPRKAPSRGRVRGPMSSASSSRLVNRPKRSSAKAPPRE